MNTKNNNLAASAAAMLLASGLARANTFTAVSGNDWNTPENWSGGVPVAEQNVVINDNVMLTNATPLLSSYTLNVGATHTFNGWDSVLNASVVTINGTMTHAPNTDSDGADGWTPNARVNIACDTLTVSAGGKIDVTGKGYAGNVGYAVNGYGPGGGKGASAGAGGGAYGGLGGSFSAPYGLAYGLPEEPEQPGSSGGSGNNALVFGGSGGGVIRIQASGGVQVAGSLLADGVAAVGFRCGGGSGGAIYITCSVISGTGVLSANGKAGIAAGGGGGGRIAVVYDPGAQALVALPGLQFATLPAKGLISGTIVANGDVGSLYFSDSQFLFRQAGAIMHSGEWHFGTVVRDWSCGNLALSNAWLRIPVEGFDLEVANNISIVGTDAYLSKLELTNATVAVGGNVGLAKSSLVLHRGTIGITVLDCGGDLTLADSSALYVEGIATNGLSTSYGARVTVNGDMDIADASWVYPASAPKTGGAVRFQVGGLRVASGAGFNASELGYAGGGIKSGMGYGPGGGYGSTSGSGGGGYGGRGGLWNATSGKTYGLAYAPTEPGSGGGHDTGKAGGGVIWVETDGLIDIDGSLVASGGNGGYRAGGGSGGGVLLACRKLLGSGTIEANGGKGGDASGGGGGGRVAVWQGSPLTGGYQLAGTETSGALPESFSGSVSVMGGLPVSGTATPVAEAGTFLFLKTTPPTLIILR